ncbi:hypothetical protein KBZ10_19920 [Streptomyces sp. F63]|uniref:hypothetical protein n=1 Tax=Streptomyces sp. F63 TaxID=2824887 RepID=UPI001B38F017|nr:hypothetical protein [Streptomyces sp. F63]MBQ0986737.1 hypothetical protein [Streptomyces sp. F63]
MPAGTHASHPADRAAQARLPWWAVVLPAVAFAVLLALITSAQDAQAAAGAPTGLRQLLDLLRNTLFRGLG